MSWVTFVSTQQDPFIKHIKWVRLGQTPLLTSNLGLKNHNTIIKWVGFGLSHLVEYPYLDITRTRYASPN